MIDPPCKRAGCKHALSIHTLTIAEKRNKLEGTISLDFPSGQRDREFNIQAGRSNSSCSESDCDCLAYMSPNG